MGRNLETRSFLDEVRSFDKHGGLFDLGHPLLNRMAETFVKAAGVRLSLVPTIVSVTHANTYGLGIIDLDCCMQIGAVQAASREVYFTAFHEGSGRASTTGTTETPPKKHRFSELKGETIGNSVEALVVNTTKESLQWGLACGMYSGVTYGLKEARGVHDWKNSAVAGAITGAAVALTLEDCSHEDVVQSAITGAALSTAANLLTGIF